MAPAASSILSSAAAAGSKRPSDSDAAEQLDSSALPQQGGDEATRKSQQPTQQLECPRCRSTNTKFCYYNNYSTAQPRHFCRACRRYWTHGGALRDVPVGGACHRTAGSKRRRVSPEPSSSPQTTEDASCPAGLSASTLFPFLSDGSFLPPHFDFDRYLGVAPAAFSWPSSAFPDFYYGIAPWDDGTLGAGGVAGAWGGDIAGLELSWPPPGN